jgi:hypothetical protein
VVSSTATQSSKLCLKFQILVQRLGMLQFIRMNKNDCGTGNEQSVGYVQMTKWSAIDYQLWCSLTITKGMMVINLLNY